MKSKHVLFRFPEGPDAKEDAPSWEIQAWRTTTDTDFFDGQFSVLFDSESIRDVVYRAELEKFSDTCYIGERETKEERWDQNTEWIKIWKPGTECRQS